MNYRLVYARPDGGVSVVIPATDKTPEELAERCVPAGVPYRIVSVADIPSDRYFRNAWEDTGKITVNMEKARGIHMDKIRKVRDEELRRLDIEQLKGVDVAAEKERLRDIPATFDLTVAQTPEELKKMWPEGLAHET